jgi:Ca-activated chloride channel family protein
MSAILSVLRAIPVSFDRPWWLLALAIVPWVWWVAIASRRSSNRATSTRATSNLVGRAQRGSSWALHASLRTVVVTCLVLALAGLVVPAPVAGVATIFVVDRSESIPADVQAAAAGYASNALVARGPDDLGAIVSFGRTTRIDSPVGLRDTTAQAVPDVTAALEGADREATDLAQAIATAGAMLPPANAGYLRRIVLLSDGNETRGSALAAARSPALRSVEISSRTVPARLDDVAVAALDVDPVLHDGEGTDARVVVQSPAPGRVTLRVWARPAPDGPTGAADLGSLVFDRSFEVDQGPTEVAVPLGRLERGAWVFRAEVEASGDPVPANNVAVAHAVVAESGRVLVVEGETGNATNVAAALRSARVVVDVTTPAAMPETVDGLARYDAMVLVDVPATALSTATMTSIKSAVADRGRGLIVAGGEHTFGQGEYSGTPLEDALPVTVQLPEKDQAATLAVVIIIDRSGSMSGIDTRDRRASRMDLAKEGAILAVETLKEGDQVGVVAFDYNARWVAEMRTLRGAADVKAIADRVATIQPDGGTDIYVALDVALRGMQATQARVKHAILLTDGEGTPAPFPTLMNAYRRAGVTLSTVAVSSEAGRGLLQDLARRGSGRYYFTDTASGVPQIMTQEARLAGRTNKQERDFTPRLASAAAAVRGLVPNALPQLHGYLRTSSRPGTEIVLTSDQEETILAQWQYGLGRAIAWTSDAEGPWSRDWVANGDAFRALWTQAVQWSMPASQDPNLAVRVVDAAASCAGAACGSSRARIQVDAWAPGGGFRDLVDTTADVAGPDGTARRLILSQVGPGRYEADFDAPNVGAYFVRVTQSDASGRTVASQVAGYARAYPAEVAPLLANRTLLERLATDSGAPAVTAPEDSWRRDTIHRLAPRDIWPELMKIAIAAFVVDVAVRRLRPTWADARDMWGAIVRVARVPRRWSSRAWDWFVVGQGVTQ